MMKFFLIIDTMKVCINYRDSISDVLKTACKVPILKRQREVLCDELKSLKKWAGNERTRNTMRMTQQENIMKVNTKAQNDEVKQLEAICNKQYDEIKQMKSDLYNLKLKIEPLQVFWDDNHEVEIEPEPEPELEKESSAIDFSQFGVDEDDVIANIADIADIADTADNEEVRMPTAPEDGISSHTRSNPRLKVR
jgi:hypothetical protein